jgi:hypothetical protein
VTRCCQTRDRRRVKACHRITERSGGVAAYGTCAPAVLAGLGFPSGDGSSHHRDAIHGAYWQSEKSGLRHHRVPQLTSRRLRRANWALHRGFPCPSDLADLFATLRSSRDLGVSRTCSKARKMGMTSWRQFKLTSTGETACQSSLCCRENVTRCVSFASKMTLCFSVNLCVSSRSNRKTGRSSDTCPAISSTKTGLNTISGQALTTILKPNLM